MPERTEKAYYLPYWAGLKPNMPGDSRTTDPVITYYGNIAGEYAMTTEKDVHVKLPHTLVVQMEQAAEAERITLDELVRDAMDHRLNGRGLDEVFAFGKRHARERGLKPSDVEKAIADVRQRHTRGL